MSVFFLLSKFFIFSNSLCSDEDLQYNGAQTWPCGAPCGSHTGVPLRSPFKKEPDLACVASSQLLTAGAFKSPSFVS